LQVIGIALEQHGDRTRLFMQWKQMAWPVMIDALNLLEMKAVPVTVLIDEFGIIRKINPREADLEEFLATEYEPPASPAKPGLAPSNASPALRYAMDTVTGNRTERLGRAIKLLTEDLSTEADDGLAHFRLGVLYRLRYDSPFRQTEDFGRAIEHWSKALALDPNQYIWRRRIQQYGPQLDKPYPFYDWVATARTEIRDRGEQPITLLVEPSGAEIAHPSHDLGQAPAKLAHGHPDPNGRLAPDNGLIDVQATLVPSTDPKSRAFRAHLELRPNAQRRAYWNNEAGALSLWFTDDSAWRAEPNPVRHTLSPDTPPTSRETRHLEFEISSSPDNSPAEQTLGGDLFYYVCEGEEGTCLFLRTKVNLTLPRSPR
jgi:hypothetical protein